MSGIRMKISRIALKLEKTVLNALTIALMPKLSLAKLERHLYAAADRLRQEGLDAATYKDYIFGMLFLKRCSDVFEAEHDRIVGRKAGTVADFNYSDGLKASGITWTPDKVDAYVTAPKKVVPGGRMKYEGLEDAKARADLIAYLATLR